MPYRFATEKQDYSAYASGRVFYNAPGHPAFPVRLTSEIFQRCMAARRANGLTAPVILYDPCCGAAYHLVTLAYLHWPEIATILGSDIDLEILEVARRNLGLLTQTGLEKRKREIESMFARYGKESHGEALESTQEFKRRLEVQIHPIPTYTFQADATHPQELAERLPVHPVDMVISDVPYDQHSSWKVPAALPSPSQSPVWHMLEALLPCLSENAVVAIAADKAQKISHEAYKRADHFQVGKRRIIFLHPIADRP